MMGRKYWFAQRDRRTGPRLGGAKADRLRSWELALALALAAALLDGALAPEGAVLDWWTVMFPGLSELPGPGTASGGAESVELRWLVVELFRALFGR